MDPFCREERGIIGGILHDVQRIGFTNPENNTETGNKQTFLGYFNPNTAIPAHSVLKVFSTKTKNTKSFVNFPKQSGHGRSRIS